jgi:hypothetical protein
MARHITENNITHANSVFVLFREVGDFCGLNDAYEWWLEYQGH